MGSCLITLLGDLMVPMRGVKGPSKRPFLTPGENFDFIKTTELPYGSLEQGISGQISASKTLSGVPEVDFRASQVYAGYRPISAYSIRRYQYTDICVY